MNIDDLLADIEEMENEALVEEEKELFGMCKIATAYDEDIELCEKLIAKHRDEFGIKINII